MPNNRDTEQVEHIFANITLHSLAMDLADHAARSEIELYSAHVVDITGRHVFDTENTPEDCVDGKIATLVTKALRYIELRGSALPYRLRRSGALVWFEEIPSTD